MYRLRITGKWRSCDGMMVAGSDCLGLEAIVLDWKRLPWTGSDCLGLEAIALDRTEANVGSAYYIHIFLFQNTQVIERSSKYFKPSYLVISSRRSRYMLWMSLTLLR
jgi:hypothetical protein